MSCITATVTATTTEKGHSVDFFQLSQYCHRSAGTAFKWNTIIITFTRHIELFMFKLWKMRRKKNEFNFTQFILFHFRTTRKRCCSRNRRWRRKNTFTIHRVSDCFSPYFLPSHRALSKAFRIIFIFQSKLIHSKCDFGLNYGSLTFAIHPAGDDDDNNNRK